MGARNPGSRDMSRDQGQYARGAVIVSETVRGEFPRFLLHVAAVSLLRTGGGAPKI